MEGSRSILLKQLAAAAIGQALPQPTVLSRTFAHLRNSLIATTITGILSAALILFGCFEFYNFLLSEGLERSTVSLMTVGLLTMLIVIGGFVAAHYGKEVVKAKHSMSVLPQTSDLFAGAESLVTAFLRGFNARSQLKVSDHPPAAEGADIGRAYVYSEYVVDDESSLNGQVRH